MILTIPEMYSTITSYYSEKDVNEILLGIFVSNYRSALSETWLKRFNIQVIVNCSKDIPFITEKTTDQTWAATLDIFRVPVDDSLQQKDFDIMQNYISRTNAFLFQKYFIQKKRILIHCAAGKERSVTVLAAFIYKYFNSKIYNSLFPDMNKVLKFIVQKRPEALFFGKSINFRTSLEKYYNIKILPTVNMT